MNQDAVTPSGRPANPADFPRRILLAEPQPVAGEALCGLDFRAPARVADDPAFELWSRLAAHHMALEPAALFTAGV